MCTSKLCRHLIKHFTILLLWPIYSAQAAVTGYEIASDELYANGREFGEADQYRAIRGTLTFAVDPQNARNRIITDIELAPLDENGQLAFSSDFLLLIPVNPASGNQVTLVDIPNRGNPIMQRFNLPTTESPDGDAFLMSEGYSLLWLGWEEDIDSGFRISIPGTADGENIPISGLGFAAVRDAASWIKHDPDALVSTDYLLTFGLSQSGRYLRSFLYLGFNTDEAGRQVYDGVIPHIGGASRIDLNRRGAQPVSQGQFNATSYPFADDAYADPLSGVREGQLDNPRARENQPKIFYTNSSVEYWGGGRIAAMIHTTPDAQRDLILPENVRVYLLAGTQHGPAAFPPAAASTGQLQNNPHNYWWPMRALLTAMTEWVRDDIPPPPSAHPQLANGSLIPVSEIEFPDLDIDASLNSLDAGIRMPNPLLQGNGAPGAELPLLVPQVNEDGNEIAGIISPELTVPLATYTGWNFNNPQIGDPNRLYPLAGGYIPFSASLEERISNNDPRLSIEERYASKTEYLELITAAAEDLVAKRYLLQRDIPAVYQRASAHWDLLMSGQ